MATAKEENWQIKKRADACAGTGIAFGDGEEIMTRLLLANGEYVREDYSLACWEEQNPDHGVSAWKSVYHAPPPPQEVVKKESAETLLRKMIAKEDADDINAIYILAVMLERKKILVEKDVQTREDKTKVRVYEHKKSGDTFLVVDPELKLDELEAVQEEVVGLLGGKPPKTETVHQFEQLTKVLVEKYTKLLFPRRTVGGEEGITQKLAASFFALLAGKKYEHYAVSEKIMTRYETNEQYGDLVESYRELIDVLPQEIRFQGLEKPELARQIEAMAAREPNEIDPNEVLALFESDDSRITALRDKLLEAVRAAVRYADG
ncbi:hypothetical protein [Tichowtungia aerotolerans]|uniref:Uncharacterized protein n=1 Tax=Tichowtungia aerotolerans TaxID=2697043 RepID=A0A6P1M2H2_9BACT|nr:hypothetical protein [Tichowtungia aerotolerans]QHI68790.1 hypothetical protein GT409_04775 [Tichowtungia aerotolerans]